MFVAIDIEDSPTWAARASKHQSYTCPECGDAVILKCVDSVYQPHFAHKKNSDCKGLESDEHLFMKFWYVEQLEIMGAENISYEKRITLSDGRWRQPDVAFTWNGNRYAIEVQRSKITPDLMLERSSDLMSKGVRPFWVVSKGWQIGSGMLRFFVAGEFEVTAKQVRAPMPLWMVNKAPDVCVWIHSAGSMPSLRQQYCYDDIEVFINETEKKKAETWEKRRKLLWETCRYTDCDPAYNRIFTPTHWKVECRRIIKIDYHVCAIGNLACFRIGRKEVFIISDMAASWLGLLKSDPYKNDASRCKAFRLHGTPNSAYCEHRISELRLGEARDHGFDSVKDLVDFKQIISESEIYKRANDYLDDLFAWPNWIVKSHMITRSDALSIHGVNVPIPAAWHQRWPNPLPSFLTMKFALLRSYSQELSR